MTRECAVRVVRGINPFADAEEFGEELIPCIRVLVAERDGRCQNRSITAESPFAL